MKYINFPQIWQKAQNLLNRKIDAVIVVDIGSDLKLLNVELKNEIKITALSIVELADGQRDESILNSLSNFIRENNIRHRNAILSPRLNSLIIKRLQLPAIPEKELPQAIKWQLKEEASFDLAGAVMDFYVLKETAGSDGARELEVISAIAAEQEIKPLVLLLRQLGFSCLSVIPLVFGYSGLLGRLLLEDKDEFIGILHLQEDHCFIAIYKDNKLEFYREIPLSICKLRGALKVALVSDKGKIELSDVEAGEVLFNIGVPQKDLVYKDRLSSEQILSMLRPILEQLAQEIRRTLTYYASQFQKEAVVNKIFLAGLALKVPAMDKFLSQELSLLVQRPPLLDKKISAPNISPEVLLQGYAGLGLALDYERSINLLPYEFHAERIERLQKVSLRWVAFIAFSLFVFSYMFAKVGVSAYQKRLDNALLHLNVLSEVKQIKSSLDALNKFTIEARNSEPPAGIMLKELSSIAVRDLFIDSFSLNRSSKIVTVMGFIKSAKPNQEVILTKFVGDMQGSSYFLDGSISSVEKIKKEDGQLLKFNLTFKLP